MTKDLALYVINSYDGIPGTMEELKGLLPRSEPSPLPGLILVGALSVGCTQERFVPATFTPIVVSQADEHNAAVGMALYSCLERRKESPSFKATFNNVWAEIKKAGEEVGDRKVCVTAAALLACDGADIWMGVDRYLEQNPRETCATLIIKVDDLRAVRELR